MKTIIKTFVLLAFTFAAFQTNAQGPMSKGVKVVQAGVAMGGWSGIYTSETPIINGTFMIGIKDNFGAGNLSVGGQVGYKGAKWDTWTFNYTFVAGRAAWHPYFIKSDKIDVYGGVSLGLYHLAWDAGADDAYIEDLSTTAAAFSIFLGGRYEISEQFGVYAELGAGLGVLNAGVAYKF